MYDYVIKKHSKIALQFSGGRDSFAVLHLMRPYWDRLTVYHLNSGNQYPEVTAAVQRVAEMVPNFKEIEGSVKHVHDIVGWPSDLVPVENTKFAHQYAGKRKDVLIDRYTCCFLAIMRPMHEAMVQDGITLIIRGQRNDDADIGPMRSGSKANGFEFLFPIEDWSAKQVMRYLKELNVELPPFYDEGLTSTPDCLHCTAWLEHGAIPYLRKHYPLEYNIVSTRLHRIREAVNSPLQHLDSALKG